MKTQIYYHGSDGHVKQLGDQELQHWKYIKKIGNRYFYTPEELKAYYAEAQDSANREAAFNKNTVQDESRWRKDMNKNYYDNKRKQVDETQVIYRDKNDNLQFRDHTKKEKEAAYKRIKRQEKKDARLSRLIDRVANTKIEAKRRTDPLKKTAKMAVKGKEKPKTTKSKYSNEDLIRIRSNSQVRAMRRREALKKERRRKEMHRQYSPASRW